MKYCLRNWQLSAFSMWILWRCGWTVSHIHTVIVLVVWSLLLSNADGYGNSMSPHTEYWATVNFSYIDPVTHEANTENEMGLYGSDSRIAEEWGMVVHVQSNDNRTDGCRPPVNAVSEQWIALIERGSCKFQKKIHNAAIVSNASAVVIYNNAHEVHLLTMKHEVDDVVSVFVSKQSGRRIASLVDNGTRVMVHIKIGPVRSNDGHNVNRMSVLFVSISFIVLMIISLAWLIFYYVQRFRYAHTKDRLAKRLTIAAKKAVSKMSQRTIRRGDVETDPDFDLCAICVEGYKVGEVLRILPCKHLFHKLCIDPWLIDQRSCPICKLDILQAYGYHISHTKESASTDTEMPFIYADATDYLLGVGEVGQSVPAALGANAAADDGTGSGQVDDECVGDTSRLSVVCADAHHLPYVAQPLDCDGL